MKPIYLIALIVLVALGSNTHAATSVQESSAFPPGGSLEVSNVAGWVKIIGWNRSEIEVVADFDSEHDRLEFEVRGNDAYVGVRSEKPRKKKRNYGQDDDAYMTIRVPQATRLQVNTVSADIEVEQSTGEQRLESVSGDIDTGLAANLGSYRTVSGDIDITGAGNVEHLKVNTVSGDVDARGVGGELRFNTVSGDMDVRAGRFSRLYGNTVSGDMDVRGEFERGGEIDFESVNGDLLIEVPSLYDTEFHLESFNGDIDPVLGYKASRKSRYAPGRILRLTEGDGSSHVRAETLNGSIVIKATGGLQREPTVRHTSGRLDVTIDDHDHNDHNDNDNDYDDRERAEDDEDFDAAMERMRRNDDGT